MSTRVNPFANLEDPPVFTTKAKKETPVEKETIERIAEQNNFPSRQAPKPSKAERRKPRIYLYMANSKIMRRLESDTSLENVYATGRTRNRLVTPVR